MKFSVKKKSILTKNFFNKNKRTQVWMNHNDVVIKIPKGFEGVASSDDYKYTIIQDIKKKNIWSSVPSGSNSY